MTEFVIRPAREADVPAILEIVNHAILHTTANYDYEPHSLETELQWFHDKQLNNFPILVADYSDKILGFASYGPFRSRHGYRFTVEHSVYVHPDFTGKKIGSALLEKLIETARFEGYHLMIGGIDASNENSIRFHEKFGFERCGLITEAAFKFGRWLDLQFMSLKL